MQKTHRRPAINPSLLTAILNQGGPPPRLHSLCYVFQDKAGKSVVWMEAERDAAGYYDVLKYDAPVQSLHESTKGSALMRAWLFRTKTGLEPEAVAASADFLEAHNRIARWDRKMQQSSDARVLCEAPKLMSFHPSDEIFPHHDGIRQPRRRMPQLAM